MSCMKQNKTTNCTKFTGHDSKSFIKQNGGLLFWLKCLHSTYNTFFPLSARAYTKVDNIKCCWLLPITGGVLGVAPGPGSKLLGTNGGVLSAAGQEPGITTPGLGELTTRAITYFQIVYFSFLSFLVFNFVSDKFTVEEWSNSIFIL